MFVVIPCHEHLYSGKQTGFWAFYRRKWPLGESENIRSMTAESENGAETGRKITIFGRDFRMPRSRGARIAIGILLVILGLLGFLPILGFWMIPLGLLVLSYEFASVRRGRRRFVVWWERRRARKRP